MKTGLKFLISIAGAAGLLGAAVTLSSAPNSEPSASQFRIFNNCYGLLTGKALHLDSPYLTRLREGSVSGAGLCREILSDLHLDDEGRVSSSGRADRNIAQAVMQRMQLLHQSWFNRMTFINSEKEFASSAVIDVQEPANYLTWSLFSEVESGSIFINDLPPVALRQTAVPQEFLLEKDINMGRAYRRSERKWLVLLHEVDPPAPEGGYDPKKETEWQPEYVPMGELVGFLAESPSRRPAAVYEIPKRSFGGGVLGTQSYFSSNTGMDLDKLADGALKMHRRWGENILKDFLCRDLPVLSEADVAENVNPKSSVTYRQQAECMKCHQSMDNLAAGARDLYISWTGFDVIHPFFARIVRRTQTRDPASVSAPLVRDEADARYAFAPADGEFNYRNLDGERVSFKFKSLSELGRHIAESKDFHFCLAKRYIKYFTGYDMDLLARQPDSAEARESLRLAGEFYSHRRQKRLLMEIVESPLFTRERSP